VKITLRLQEKWGRSGRQLKLGKRRIKKKKRSGGRALDEKEWGGDEHRGVAKHQRLKRIKIVGEEISGAAEIKR